MHDNQLFLLNLQTSSRASVNVLLYAAFQARQMTTFQHTEMLKHEEGAQQDPERNQPHICKSKPQYLNTRTDT